jgi:hypothetical protein
MDDQTSGRRYRPIYRDLRIGAKEYPVLDLNLAKQRAQTFLDEALGILNLSKITPAQQQQLHRCLLIATDLSSKDAPYLLALQCLHGAVDLDDLSLDGLHFFKIAADRGHGDAAYRLATAYAGTARFPELEEYGFRYFHALAPRERQRWAEHYFHAAMAQEHQEAMEDLIIAYAYGRGFIPKNAASFVNVCETLVKRKNQAVTLGYGAWLAGMTVEGSEPLPEAIQLPIDANKALEFLLVASRGAVVELSQHALHLISLGMVNGLWNLKFFGKRLLREANQQHSLLAFYFAWYSIPVEIRAKTPALIEHYPLIAFAELVEPDEEQAVHFLKVALFGDHEELSLEAKNLLNDVFGSYYLDEAEALLLEEI